MHTSACTLHMYQCLEFIDFSIELQTRILRNMAIPLLNINNQQVLSVGSLPTSTPTISIEHQPPTTTQTTCDLTTSSSCNGIGESCVQQASCHSFQAGREALKKLKKGSKDYQDALDRLKSQICNKSCKYVCCNQSPPIWHK